VDAAANIQEGQRGSVVSGAYEKYLSQFRSVTDELDPTEVRKLLNGAHDAHFFSGNENYLVDELSYIKVLEKIGVATKGDYDVLFGSYIKSRDFIKAKVLNEAHELGRDADLPKIIYGQNGSDGHLVYSVVGDKKLLLASARFGTGPQVVVVAHPLCHFSNNATKAIESDKGLSKIFDGHSVWIVPPEEKLNLGIIYKWNEQHPEEKMVLTHDVSQWPQIDSWATPTFYFFKNGKLMKKVVGWGADGNKSEIISAARFIGLPGARKADLVPLE
jgi:hypothetical protein